MAYADKTKVSVDRSQAEIKKTLSKYGASAFAFAENKNLAVVQFEIKGKRIRFAMPLPVYGQTKIIVRGINCLAGEKHIEQMCRSKWRSLGLAVKAKLEAVDAGITTLEQEFLAHIMLPNGQTFGDLAIPQIEASYQNRQMPPLLGMG